MIPFPLYENRFSFFFFVADHVLVGQLCTNPKSDRSLLSCLKVTLCSTSEIGDAPLYNPCSLPTIASTLKRQIRIATNNRDVPRVMKTKFPATVMVFGVVSSEGHIMPPHIFEVGLKLVPGCAEECSDPLVQSGGRWQTLGMAAGLVAGTQVQRDQGLASEEVLRLCTLLSLASLLPPQSEPAGLLRLVIRREHHQHDLPQHQSQLDHRHPPSIRRAPVGDCGKGMLPVPDPYLGGDWGWRRLH